MTAASVDLQTAAGIIRQQQVLHALTLSAFAADSRQNLGFRILNESIKFTSYNRASLWQPSGERKAPLLLGISGTSEVKKRSPLAEEWRQLLGAIPDLKEVQILGAANFPKHEDLWTKHAERTEGLSVLWLPIKSGDHLRGGLWLERWGALTWTEGEILPLVTLAETYALAWGRFTRGPSWLGKLLKSGSFFLILAVLYTLVFVRVPLRVIAGCEVIPRDPVVVSAPLPGVVESVRIKPGSLVKKGDLLFSYDKRLTREDLDLAAKRLKITAAELRRAQIQALDDPRARSELRILKRRLDQGKVRLAQVARELVQMDVRAPTAGQTLIESPNEWRGRPVRVGERVMLIVRPGETMVKIWIPEDDNIDFLPNEPLKIVLNVRPEAPLLARLDYIAHNARPNQQGLNSFVAEAKWKRGTVRVKPGLKGTAVLYGKKVAVGYWLFRKPYAAVRRFFGW